MLEDYPLFFYSHIVQTKIALYCPHTNWQSLSLILNTLVFMLQERKNMLAWSKRSWNSEVRRRCTFVAFIPNMKEVDIVMGQIQEYVGGDITCNHINHRSWITMSSPLMALTQHWGAAVRHTPNNGWAVTHTWLWLLLSSWCQTSCHRPLKTTTMPIPHKQQGSVPWWIPGGCCHSRAFDQMHTHRNEPAHIHLISISPIATVSSATSHP